MSNRYNEPIRMEGARPLFGEVQVQGSKNAALPILAASILVHGKTILHRCPDITDITYMQKILESAGCGVARKDGTIEIEADNVKEFRLPKHYVKQMRSSVVLMGALLGRVGRVGIDYPGGCVIGERPIDLHLMALEKLGTKIDIEGSYIYAEAKQLRGAEITFPFSSVGATQNALLAAVTAKGCTVLNCAAKEPEIVAISDFLNKAGAQIEGAGTDRIVIHGVSELKETQFQVPADRIVAGTYLFAAMGAGGKITLHHAPTEQMESVLQIITQMGGILSCETDSKALVLEIPERIRNISYVETGVYPAFPTDLQSSLLAAACKAEGRLELREKIFTGRFKIVEELLRMGADISCVADTVSIQGVRSLEGRNVIAKELRGGAALVAAGLSASGITTVMDTCYIQRGYENIVRDFKQFGANIGRCICKKDNELDV